ncbi:KamA family radical SAM protein, partial [candidate division CSSED10-310 bacterium]
MEFRDHILKLWAAHPDVYHILKSSENVVEARIKLNEFTVNEREAIEKRAEWLHPLDYDIMIDCLSVLKTMIGERSEKLSNFSILKTLLDIAQNDPALYEKQLSIGFIDDLRHLFLGIRGQTGMYDRRNLPLFLKLKGREAAVMRSQDLEDRATLVRKGIERYPTGLDEVVKQKRRDNVERIRAYFKASKADWSSYTWHLKHIIRNSSRLKKLIQLTDEEKESIDLAIKFRLPFGITPYYVSLMDYEPTRKYDHA